MRADEMKISLLATSAALIGATLFLVAACTAAPQSVDLATATAPPTLAEATALPSLTPSPGLATPTTISTEAVTPAGIASTPDWTQYDLDAQGFTSPDGQWSANLVVAWPQGSLGADQYHVLFKLINWSKGQETVLVEEWRNIGLGYTVPSVVLWSLDRGSLFIGEAGVPDGCGAPFVERLQRVELETVEITPVETEAGGRLSVSPDGSWLAFYRGDSLVRQSLDSGAERIIAFEPPAGDWRPGMIEWAPADDALVFALETDPCLGSKTPATAIFRVELGDAQAPALLVEEDRSLSLHNWPVAGSVQLLDDQEQAWWLDPLTGVISAQPPPDIGQAQAAVLAYFSALEAGRFGEVDRWYGGVYDVLEEYNPGVDPLDRASLWRSACQVNGFECLAVAGMTLDSQPGPDAYRFLVWFEKDGELFTRGPCCGGDISDFPPEWRYAFTVQKDDSGQFRVQELPVLMP